MSLTQALAHAREAHPELRAARGRIAALRAEAAVPGAQWRPTLSATVQLVGSTVNNSTTTMIGNTGVDIARIGGTDVLASPDFTPYASTFAAIGARQQIFDFGRVAAQTAARQAAVEVERIRADAAQVDVAADVTQAYFAVRAAHAVLAAAAGAEGRARVHRDAAGAAVERGLRPAVDLARVEANLARFEAGHIRAAFGLQAARGVFAAVVGVPEPLLDAADGAEVRPFPDLSRTAEAATRESPVVREAAARLAQARAETRAEAARLRPDVHVSATLSARAGGAPPANGPEAYGDGWLPVVPNYHAGLVLSWPLLDPTISARRDAARRWEGARRTELEAARLGQLARVRQAHADVAMASASLDALERLESAALLTQSHAEARFLSGLGTAVELADAEALLAEAQIQHAMGTFEIGRARAALARVVGEVER